MPQRPAAPGLRGLGDERQAIVSALKHSPPQSPRCLDYAHCLAAVVVGQSQRKFHILVIRKSKYILFNA